MSRFGSIVESIFAPASPEEAEERRKAFPEAVRREWVENFLKREDVRRNPDGSYDVDGEVDLAAMDWNSMPLRFGKVRWGFYCGNNRLTSLAGSPRKVGGVFYCWRNMLTSLEGGPSEVGGNFGCNGNLLTTLEGAPKEVGGGFWCNRNPRKFTEEDVREVCEVEGEIHV